MSGYIRVLNTDECGLVQDEIIRLEDLIKIYKNCGNSGTGISFEYMSNEEKRKWTYECRSNFNQNRVYNIYVSLLCGKAATEVVK